MVNVPKQETPRPTKPMGDRLRLARESHGLSTQAASERAGISPGYLFKLESGFVGTPSPRVLDRLASVLEIDYWQLAGLAGFPVPTQDGGRTTVPQPEERESGSLVRIAAALESIHGELRAIREHLESADRRASAPEFAPVDVAGVNADP